MANVCVWISLVLVAISFSRGTLGHTIRSTGRLEPSEMNQTNSTELLIPDLLTLDGNSGSQVIQIEQTSDGAGSENSTSLSRTIEVGNKLGRRKRDASSNGQLQTRDGSSSKVIVNNCPTSERDKSVEFPPECCSFPFTLNRQLHYQCFPGTDDGLYGCFIPKRIWVACAEPITFVAHNQTVTTTIPLVARFTSVTVNNWIVFQQRVDSTAFPRSTWVTSKVGFGSPAGLFWLGLEKVHKMTYSAPYKLRMEFRILNGSWYSVEYDTFRVESELQNYRIHVRGYSGDFCDVMNIPSYVNNDMSFSTYDRENDLSSGNCEQDGTWGHGGWWHGACGYFHLNGNYYGNHGFSALCNGAWYYFSASRMMLKKK
jgi:hypothetical protein